MIKRIALFVIGVVLCATGARADEPACLRKDFEGSAFVVCRFEARRDHFELVLADRSGHPYREFARLRSRPDARKIRFAMNAGMFDPGGRPIGLFVENGVVGHTANTGTGNGNFYLKPNGVFSVGADGALRIETTDAFLRATQSVRGYNGLSRDGRKVRWATQSGPMLVIGGQLHPMISGDGPSRYIRNGVGVRDDGTAFFVISGEPVSFGRLARFFRDGLRCPDALYLDGFVSSLWWPAAGREDHSALLGPMAVVLDR